MFNTSPPHNKEAEQKILGSIICEASNFEKIQGKLYPNDFYQEAHQKIWQGISDLEERGEEVNLLTLNEILRQQGQLDKVGGPAYISELTDNLITSSNIESALKLIKRDSNKRWLLQTARKCEEACLNGGDPSEILSNLQNKIDLIKQEISFEDSEKKSLPTARLIIDQLKTEIKQNKERGFLGIDPGFEFLRKTIKAFIPGHLWIAGGYTSHGKTAFAVELISRVLSNSFGVHITLFSTEMSAEAYILWLVANQTGTPSLSLLQGNHISEIQNKVEETFKVISKSNLIIFDDVYWFKEMARQARNIKVKVGLDLLFIDFIQNIMGEGSIYERMSILAPQLQALAKELSCTVIATSQVSNEAVKDNSGLIGFKGAGEIAAAADLGLWLERERDRKEGFKVNSEVLNIFIRKNRHGPTGKSTLRFFDNFTRLEEVN